MNLFKKYRKSVGFIAFLVIVLQPYAAHSDETSPEELQKKYNDHMKKMEKHRKSGAQTDAEREILSVHSKATYNAHIEAAQKKRDKIEQLEEEKISALNVPKKIARAAKKAKLKKEIEDHEDKALDIRENFIHNGLLDK